MLMEKLEPSVHFSLLGQFLRHKNWVEYEAYCLVIDYVHKSDSAEKNESHLVDCEVNLVQSYEFENCCCRSSSYTLTLLCNLATRGSFHTFMWIRTLLCEFTLPLNLVNLVFCKQKSRGHALKSIFSLVNYKDNTVFFVLIQSSYWLTQNARDIFRALNQPKSWS